MIDFLEDRLNSDLSIFEYGSGSSTLYFGSKVGEVMSVEYDPKWFDKVQGLIDGTTNVEVHFIDLKGPYVDAIEVLGKGKKFDLVIVDGRERVACAIKAFDFVSQNGVVLLDDTHRKHYQDAFDFYRSKGWKALTFSGLKPTGFGMDQSTLFYRSGQNCLDL
jgi:tRNA A58 N-methylase Trm61